MNDCGDPDRAPCWIGFGPQASFFGGAEAAIGAMTAYWYRTNSGEGQFVDVSIQEATMSSNMNVLPMWDVNQVEFRRVGAVSFVAATRVKQPIYFRCKDGLIMILALGWQRPLRFLLRAPGAMDERRRDVPGLAGQAGLVEGL